MLNEKQIKEIKKQIIQQIEANLPEDKKQQAISQINAMDSEQIEEFLKQNNMAKDSKIQEKCVFCSIVFGDISSYKVGENEKAMAVLEINPISKAHSLVIPKEHVSDKKQIPKEAKELAKQISKQIKKQLKPKQVKILSSNLFGHEILNVLPVYKDETPDSERKKAAKEELEEVQKLLTEPPKEKPKEAKKPKPKEINEKLWLPRRIP